MESKEDLSLLIRQLDNMLSDLRWSAIEAEGKLDEICESIDEERDKGIKDVDYFIKRLIADNLYTDEMKKFLDDYMKFYND